MIYQTGPSAGRLDARRLQEDHRQPGQHHDGGATGLAQLKEVLQAVELYRAKQPTVKEIYAMMGIPKPTFYADVRQAQASASAHDTEC